MYGIMLLNKKEAFLQSYQRIDYATTMNSLSRRLKSYFQRGETRVFKENRRAGK